MRKHVFVHRSKGDRAFLKQKIIKTYILQHEDLSACLNDLNILYETGASTDFRSYSAHGLSLVYFFLILFK